MLVYLAGPIDGVPADEAGRWRQVVADYLSFFFGVASFDPSRPWRVMPHRVDSVASAMIAVNRMAIDHSSAVIANLAGPGRAIGTIREIEYAVLHNVPVMVLLDGEVPPTAALHDVWTCALPASGQQDLAMLAEIGKFMASRVGASFTGDPSC